MMRQEWTDERIEMLKGGCADKMPMADIADRINRNTGSGFSRNAIIGKADRMGLHKNRPKPAPKPKPRAERKFVFVAPPLQSNMRPDLVRAIVRRPPPGPFLGIALLDLKPEHCRYPRGGDEPGEPILFCGQPKKKGSSYCAACHARCNTGLGRVSGPGFFFGRGKERAA